MRNDSDFLTNVTRTDAIKVLGFGQGSVGHGRDSRYWDRDDRRRDEDYNEDDVEHDSKVVVDNESTEKGIDTVKGKNGKEKASKDGGSKGLVQKGVGLYNEDGRKELKMYEEEYEASLKSAGISGKEKEIKNSLLHVEDNREQNQAVDSDNEYDDGIDIHDPRMEEYGGDSQHDKGDQSDVRTIRNEDKKGASNSLDADGKDENYAKDNGEDSLSLSEKDSFINSDSGDTDSRHASSVGQSTSKSRSDLKKRPKRRKFSGNLLFFLTQCEFTT